MPITNTAWVHARLCKLQKGCTRLATARDKVYQVLAHGQWFFLGTPASSTTKTVRHDIAEILLKVALNTNKSINKWKPYRDKDVTSSNKMLNFEFYMNFRYIAFYVNLCVKFRFVSDY